MHPAWLPAVLSSVCTYQGGGSHLASSPPAHSALWLPSLILGTGHPWVLASSWHHTHAVCGEGGTQESMSLLLHPARAHEGFGRLPQGNCPHILSSKSITTVPCAPQAAACCSPGSRVQEAAELLSSQTPGSSEGLSHVGTCNTHMRVHAGPHTISRSGGGETPLGSTVTHI